MRNRAYSEPEEVEVAPESPKGIPPYGTVEWIQYVSELEGHLPTPINVSITGSTKYLCPELKWYNYDVYAHKINVRNTGYTVLVGAKWKAERPFLEGGPFLERHMFSQAHFHWGASMMEGSDHTVDKCKYPGEMQVTYFKSEYLTQEEAIRHPDGVVMVCYIIKHGVTPDERLKLIIEGFPRIKEAKTVTKIGPYPMSSLMPMFFEDYFLYWGTLSTEKGEKFVIRWLVPRVAFHATTEQMQEFRKLWDPWDEPNLQNYRPLQKEEERTVFFINSHWSQHASLLPMPRILEPSISVLSYSYQNNMSLLPPQNAYMLPESDEEDDEVKNVKSLSDTNNSTEFE